MQPIQTFTGLALMPPTGLNFGQAFKDASLKAGQLGAIAAKNALLSKQMVASLPQPPRVAVGALIGAITPLSATLEMLKASRLSVGDLTHLATPLADLSRPVNSCGTFIAPPFTKNQSVTTQDTNQ